MEALTKGILAAAALGVGYHVYTMTRDKKVAGTAGTGTVQLDQQGKPTGEARVLTPDQVALVTTLLGNYTSIAPTPIPGCAAAALIAGRLPIAGETVDGSLNMATKARDAQNIGDVYVDAGTAGSALTGVSPTGVQFVAVQALACPDVVANLKAQGAYLYLPSKVTA